MRRIASMLRNASVQGEAVTATAQVRRSNDKWNVRLQTRQGDRAGTRALDAADCLELADATALILAMMVAPDAVLAPEPDEPKAPPARPTPRTQPPPEPSPPQPPRDQPQPQTRLHFTPWIASDTGSLPSTSLGLAASLGLDHADHRLELHGTMWSSKAATAESTPVGADVRFWTGAIRACRVLWRPSGLAACTGAEVGTLRAAGFGADNTREESATWSAIAAGADLAPPLTSTVSLRLSLGFAFPLSRRRVIVLPEGEVHRPSWVAFRAAAGFSWNFL